MGPSAGDLAAWKRWWASEGARELDALLTRHWDPLDIRFRVPAEARRYERWRVRLGLRLRQGTSVEDIVDILRDPTLEMAGRINGRQLDALAREIVAWYERASARRPA